MAALEKDRQNSEKELETAVFEERQQPQGELSEPLTILSRIRRILNLVTKFREDLRLNKDTEGRGCNMQEIGRH